MSEYKVSADESNSAKEAEEKKRELLKAYQNVARSKSGKLVLRHLMELCGFKQGTITMDKDHRIMQPESEYNATRRTVYLEIRQNIPWNLLNDIEAERKPENATRNRNRDKSDGNSGDSRTKRRQHPRVQHDS